MIITIRGNKDEDLIGVANEMMSFFNIELQYSCEVKNGKYVTRMPHARSEGHATIIVTTESKVQEDK